LAHQPGPPTTRSTWAKRRRSSGTSRWARRVSNLRPLACEASALPLSYAPWAPDSIGLARYRRRRQEPARPPWLEPYAGDSEWRSWMWGGIVALHGRYPTALAELKDGWWNSKGWPKREVHRQPSERMLRPQQSFVGRAHRSRQFLADERSPSDRCPHSDDRESEEMPTRHDDRRLRAARSSETVRAIGLRPPAAQSALPGTSASLTCNQYGFALMSSAPDTNAA
jgi:hypothetical protein